MIDLSLAENSTGTARAGVRGRPFRPGESGNVGGRPKGFGALIREQTRDGAELVDFALSILRGKRGAKLDQRLDALCWLADRGWGKAIQSTEITGANGGAIIVKGYQTVTPDDWPTN
jgi:hypothetical protein